MPMERQKTCPACGPVLARKVAVLTNGEIIGLGALSLFTCGLGLLIAIPYAIYRGIKAAGWHCPKCGSQILEDLTKRKPEEKLAPAPAPPAAVVPAITEKPTESLVCPTCGHVIKSTKTLGLAGSTVATCKHCSTRFSLSQARQS